MGAIIDKLKDESILDIWVDDGETSVTFYSTQSAWDYSESISKVELGQLIQELTEIHGKLKD